jgi:hypothetical protein
MSLAPERSTSPAAAGDVNGTCCGCRPFCFGLSHTESGGKAWIRIPAPRSTAYTSTQDERLLPTTASPVRRDRRTRGTSHVLQRGEQIHRAPREGSRTARVGDRPGVVAELWWPRPPRSSQSEQPDMTFGNERRWPEQRSNRWRFQSKGSFGLAMRTGDDGFDHYEFPSGVVFI